MANWVNIPLAWPFKMVPATQTPGIHFDDKWSCEQLNWLQLPETYIQKWEKADTTPLQIESSITPDPLKVLDNTGVEVHSINWTAVITGINYKIYELTFDISSLPEGKYFIYQRVAFGSINWRFISEAIQSKVSWPRTLPFIYGNSVNDNDVAWSTGIRMLFRCEALVHDPEFKREITDFINQVHDVRMIKGTPYREFTLDVGTARGVAPWVADLMNRIFACDYIDIKGLRVAAKPNTEGKTNKVKTKQLLGWSQEIVHAFNRQSLQMSDTTPLAPGFVAAYEIQTSFLGPVATIPVTQVEKNG